MVLNVKVPIEYRFIKTKILIVFEILKFTVILLIEIGIICNFT
jgi:hypothetical protein